MTPLAGVFGAIMTTTNPIQDSQPSPNLRSAKKCREKFQNFYNYRKRTKGRLSKAYGKTYGFFNQLDALREDNDLLYLDYPFKRRLNDDFGTRSEQNDFLSNCLQNTRALPGSSVQWKNMRQDPSLPNSMQPNNLLYLSRSVLHFPPQNGAQFCAKRVAYSPTGDQFEKLPAESLDSINQPQPELSSSTSTSANVSHFRKLLRKVTYGNESSSINQVFSIDTIETCLELRL